VARLQFYIGAERIHCRCGAIVVNAFPELYDNVDQRLAGADSFVQ
jgi:hypothetical protein